MQLKIKLSENSTYTAKLPDNACILLQDGSWGELAGAVIFSVPNWSDDTVFDSYQLVWDQIQDGTFPTHAFFTEGDM